MFDVSGKTMIITGGAGNTGLAIVRAALEGGMNVAFMSSLHSRAQEAMTKLDPKYKDHVVGYAQNRRHGSNRIWQKHRKFIKKTQPRRMF